MTGNADVRSFAPRLDALLDEKERVAEDIRDVLSEAEASGLNKRALFTAVKRRREDETKRVEFESRVEAYASQLDMFADKAA